jgi:phage terminase large subunit-like protein
VTKAAKRRAGPPPAQVSEFMGPGLPPPDPVTFYAVLVLTGREIAGPYVRAACQRHLNDVKYGHERGIWFDTVEAARIFRFFEERLKLTEGQFEGRSFKLHISQAFILGSLYGWKRKNDEGLIVRRFQRAYIEMGKGNGKALSCNTPIPTPEGWFVMADLQPGDTVFDDTGAACKVTAVSDIMIDRPCYRVRFNDGSEMVADASHLWRTAALRTGLPKGPKAVAAPRKGGYAIRTTEQIARTLTTGPTRSAHPQAKWNHRVDVAGSLDLPTVDLPVPPYTLGAWLGDGDSDCARLTVAYTDWGIVETIEAEGVQAREQQKHSETTARVILGSAGRGGPNADKLNAKLRALGVLGKKFIPVSYLRASIDQRVALLQGLMDTDGTVAKNGQCELTLCSSGLADDAVELIASLGFKPTRKIGEAKLNGRVVGHRHRVQFWAYDNQPVFRLRRKADRLRQRPPTRSISQGRMIVGCDPVPSVPVKCISVDSPSRMFLAGRTMIPTHNSPLVGGMGLYGMIADQEPGAQIYSCGATYDQANILFQDAVKMALAVEDWNDPDDPLITFSGNQKIYNMAVLPSPQAHSFFRPISRMKGKTGSGPRPHMALCDELHEHPDGNVIEMLERGFKFRRQPLLIMITNSGSDRKSVCWAEHEHAIAVAEGDVDDDKTFSYVCSCDDDDKPFDDPSCWKKANPLLGITITNEYLRGVVKQAQQIAGKQNNILRLHFCNWTDSATAWISRKKWMACEDPALTRESMRGRKAYGGLDLSQTKDLTAKAWVFDDGFKDVPKIDAKGVIIPGETVSKPCYALLVDSYTPDETMKEREEADRVPYSQWTEKGFIKATPGPVVRLDFVASDLVDDCRDFDVQGVAYDQWLIRDFETEWNALNPPAVTFYDHPQGTSYRKDSELFMPRAVEMFETLILEGRLRVEVNPVLRTAVAGATFWKSPAGLKRFAKDKATNRIDPAVAAAMAISLATLHEPDMTSGWERIGQREAKAEPTAAETLANSGEIDYSVLNDRSHPLHALMVERWNKHQEDAFDDDDDY